MNVKEDWSDLKEQVDKVWRSVLDKHDLPLGPAVEKKEEMVEAPDSTTMAENSEVMGLFTGEILGELDEEALLGSTAREPGDEEFDLDETQCYEALELGGMDDDMILYHPQGNMFDTPEVMEVDDCEPSLTSEGEHLVRDKQRFTYATPSESETQQGAKKATDKRKVSDDGSSPTRATKMSKSSYSDGSARKKGCMKPPRERPAEKLKRLSKQFDDVSFTSDKEDSIHKKQEEKRNKITFSDESEGEKQRRLNEPTVPKVYPPLQPMTEREMAMSQAADSEKERYRVERPRYVATNLDGEKWVVSEGYKRPKKEKRPAEPEEDQYKTERWPGPLSLYVEEGPEHEDDDEIAGTKKAQQKEKEGPQEERVDTAAKNFKVPFKENKDKNNNMDMKSPLEEKKVKSKVVRPQRRVASKSPVPSSSRRKASTSPKGEKENKGQPKQLWKSRTSRSRDRSNERRCLSERELRQADRPREEAVQRPTRATRKQKDGEDIQATDKGPKPKLETRTKMPKGPRLFQPLQMTYRRGNAPVYRGLHQGNAYCVFGHESSLSSSEDEKKKVPDFKRNMDHLRSNHHPIRIKFKCQGRNCGEGFGLECTPAYIRHYEKCIDKEIFPFHAWFNVHPWELDIEEVWLNTQVESTWGSAFVYDRKEIARWVLGRHEQKWDGGWEHHWAAFVGTFAWFVEEHWLARMGKPISNIHEWIVPDWFTEQVARYDQKIEEKGLWPDISTVPWLAPCESLSYKEGALHYEPRWMTERTRLKFYDVQKVVEQHRIKRTHYERPIAREGHWNPEVEEMTQKEILAYNKKYRADADYLRLDKAAREGRDGDRVRSSSRGRDRNCKKGEDVKRSRDQRTSRTTSEPYPEKPRRGVDERRPEDITTEEYDIEDHRNQEGDQRRIRWKKKKNTQRER